MTQTQRTPLVVFAGQIVADTPISWTPHGDKGAKPGRIETIQTAAGRRFFLNAPAIRSAVRHAATNLLAEMSGKPYHMDDYFLAALGGIKDAKEGAKKSSEGDAQPDADAQDAEAGATKDAAEALEAAQISKKHALKYDFAKAHNPLLMLFGSMDVPGLVRCDHAIAQTESTITAKIASVRANDFIRNPSVTDILEPGAIDAFVERQVLAAKRSKAKAEIAEIDKKIKAAKKAGNADLVAELEAAKKGIDAGSNVVQLQQLLNYEAIPAGTVFSHQWSLPRVSELELALFMQALAYWALDPVIGGHRAHGLGRISGFWNVTARKPGSLAFESMGSVTFNALEGLKATGPIAQFLDPELLRQPLLAGLIDLSDKSLRELA
jgi:hypothetical protein